MSYMSNMSMPKRIRNILEKKSSKINLVKAPLNDHSISLQAYHDEILEIYKQSFMDLIGNLTTYSSILQEVMDAYDNALRCRDRLISEFVTQDLCASQSFDYLSLARERDARYTLYAENVQLQFKLKALDGSTTADDEGGDPVMLRIALGQFRELLTSTQDELVRLKVHYSETVPRAEYDQLDAAHHEAEDQLRALRAEHHALLDAHRKVAASKRALEEELSVVKERCSELERAGTPRPHWDVCADFIGGGRDRWWQLASGLTSRDRLRVLLKELGPAAESEHLEFFDGLGSEPMIPQYLHYVGRVRNLRLSRRELSVLVTDIWRTKSARPRGRHLTMQHYLTLYFRERYQQASVRAEWAYNLCAGAEQTLDDPQIKLFWGILHGQVDEQVYWGLRHHWTRLKQHLYQCARDGENVTVEEFERAARAAFPLKSEVDIRALTDVVCKQLKLKLGTVAPAATTIQLHALFDESDEGFDRSELSRELYRQRRLAQDRYIREVVAELGGRGAGAGDKRVTVDNVKRAFAVVDPAIDHIRMERYIRWAFSFGVTPRGDGEEDGEGAAGEMAMCPPLPLRTVAARLAAGDIERVGPRSKARHRRAPVYK